MEPFKQHSGMVVPMTRANVDTDQIIPKQFLKGIVRTGLGESLFFNDRYLEGGGPAPGFVLNDPKYSGGSILAAGDNFGCGSSREHAVWALSEYGFRVVIAPSLADIFKQNCYQNGLLPLELPAAEAERITRLAAAPEGYSLSVDLGRQTVVGSDEHAIQFEIDPFRKRCLMDGLDPIGLALEQEHHISQYEERARRREEVAT